MLLVFANKQARRPPPAACGPSCVGSSVRVRRPPPRAGHAQDLRDAMTVAEITELLAMHTIKSHDWHIQPCCALTGAHTWSDSPRAAAPRPAQPATSAPAGRRGGLARGAGLDSSEGERGTRAARACFDARTYRRGVGCRPLCSVNMRGNAGTVCLARSCHRPEKHRITRVAARAVARAVACAVPFSC